MTRTFLPPVPAARAAARAVGPPAPAAGHAARSPATARQAGPPAPAATNAARSPATARQAGPPSPAAAHAARLPAPSPSAAPAPGPLTGLPRPGEVSAPAPLPGVAATPAADPTLPLPDDLDAWLTLGEARALAAQDGHGRHETGLAVLVNPAGGHTGPASGTAESWLAEPSRVDEPRHAGVAVVVLSPESIVAAAAGGVAAWARRQDRVPTVVVATVGATPAARPGTPRATGLARRLVARGFDASASAGVCRVGLPAEPLALVAEAVRLRSGVPDGLPVVVGLAERSPEADELLAAADALVLALPAGADRDLAALTRDSLGRVGPSVLTVTVPTDPLGRRTAALGLRPLAPHPAERSS